MEPQIINSDEVKTLEGREREDWFWDTIERLVQTNANLVSEVDQLRGMVEKRNELLERARADQDKHVQEIIEMGKQLNEARSAAATSVQEYIANTEG